MIPADLISALANHLWQSTLFAAAAGLLALALRRNHARTRHSLWLIASLKFLIPFSLLIAVGSHFGWSTAPAVTQSGFSFVEQVGRPFTGPVHGSPLAIHPVVNLLPMILVSLWICGFLIVACVWCIRWRRIQAAVRSASPSHLKLDVPVLSSPALLEPGVFGIFRPVLLLPEGITESLTPEQINAILAHEFCHVRRRDNLAAAIHMLVEAIFWFHPLVWWIGARLVEERERACDEEVLRLGNPPQVYAESILQTCQFYLESPLACMSGVTGADLKKRVVRIMTHCAAQHLSVGKKLLLAAAAALAIAAPITFGLVNASQSDAVSEAPTTPKPSFEVASIKPNHSGANAVGMFPSPGWLRVRNYTLKSLIEGAYGLANYQISGASGWMDSERYDVVAKAADAANFTQMEPMLQALLIDRFRLKFHHEWKERDVYSLEVAKSGEKIHVSSAADNRRPSIRILDDAVIGHKTSMETFAWALRGQLDRPVVNRTGLQGSFDFDLRYTPDGSSSEDPNVSSSASLFTAIQEQLGLKLNHARAPVEMLVIDYAQKPSEN
ncbi:MAG TPA: M56 family metallopeptidase [Bryobacteraceae bacterium]|nr:M56 family metallopeptidase [Bryobacteraceae bacterium]